MKRIRGEKGQLHLSFGMIFSIILIIVFIFFAFYAIKIFLNVGEKTEIASFVKDLQTDVNKIWKASQGSQQVSYGLPSSVEKVCFIKNQEKNLVIVPKEASSFENINITHLNIERTLVEAGRSTSQVEYNGRNVTGLCFENNNKVSMILKKNFGESLVYVKKP